MNGTRALSWCTSIALLLAAPAVSAGDSQRLIAQTKGATAVQTAVPVLAGSIYKLASGETKSVPVAGASVYLHPASSQDDAAWIGPNLTDAYGRFTFQGPANGQYLMRIYSGTMRLWEQVVQIPVKLAPIVIRDIRVVYYPKSTDGTAVAAVLEKLAFPFDKADSVNAIPTNTIWFGDRVAVQDVKTIAGALLRAGVNVRAIRRFHDGGDWKARVVEVGASPKRMTGPAMQPKDVDSSKDFPRD